MAETPIRPENVYIADISADAVTAGAKRHGFRPVVLPEAGRLPFEDSFFDIVYCSSVIEHVTVPKAEVWSIRSHRQFTEIATAAQSQLAREISRVGRGYFVQTPARTFPIESHCWLPFVGRLSRPQLIKVIRLSNRLWIKKTAPDFHLLDREQMQQYFPDARIEEEKFLGMSKSLMAIKPIKR